METRLSTPPGKIQYVTLWYPHTVLVKAVGSQRGIAFQEQPVRSLVLLDIMLENHFII